MWRGVAGGMRGGEGCGWWTERGRGVAGGVRGGEGCGWWTEQSEIDSKQSEIEHLRGEVERLSVQNPSRQTHTNPSHTRESDIQTQVHIYK